MVYICWNLSDGCGKMMKMKFITNMKMQDPAEVLHDCIISSLRLARITELFELGLVLHGD